MSLSRAIATTLREGILSGRRAGKLPPERALAAELGIDRVSLRGALQELEAEGLIERVQGRGTRIRVAGKPLAEVARELLRVRRHLAAALLERLVEVRPDPSGFHAAVEDFADAIEGGDLVEADLAVLEALIEATDSPVYPMTLSPIRKTLTTLGPLAEAMYREPEANLAGWQALGAWLEDPDRAGIPWVIALLEARDEATLAGLCS